ncbi:hypothetical protein OZZ08_09530 [Malaciobacter mytili]|uniref:hypothetical protein n=1 Tax=Malaciobacter mytili TaxID=603050 RepID=UPI003BB086C5
MKELVMLNKTRKNLKTYFFSFFLLFIIVSILLFLNHKIQLITFVCGIIIFLCFSALFWYFLKKDRLNKFLIKLKKSNTRIIEKSLCLIEISLFKNDNFLIKVMYVYLLFLLGIIIFFIIIEDKKLNTETFLISLAKILNDNFFNIVGYITVLGIICILIVFFNAKLLSEYRNKIENILNEEYEKDK